MDTKQYYFQTITDKDERARQQRVFAQELLNKDIAALNFLLNNELGRWFLIRLLDSTSYQGRSFTGNSATFFNEGRRAVGIDLNERIAALGIEGIKLRQKGELEFANYQSSVVDILADKKLINNKE